MFILIKRVFLTSVFILGCAGAQASKHTGAAEGLSFDSPVKVSSNKYPIKISSVALESVVDDFKAFRKVSQQRRDSLEFLKLLSGFSKENGAAIQFSMICDQIVSKNLLKVSSLSEVSKLLSVKTEKTITEKELGDYIQVSKKKEKNISEETYFFTDLFIFAQKYISEDSKDSVGMFPIICEFLETQGLKVFLGETVSFYPMRNRGFDIKRTLSSLVLLRCQDLFSLDLSTYALVGQFLSCSQNDTSILNHNPDLLNVSFKKGKIMRKGKPLTICSYDEHVISDSRMMVDVANNDSGMIWALSLKGRMRINSSDPSCKDVTNHHHLFDGVDVACAGHIFVRAGKITYLTNGSGHYMPTIVHLLLVIKYFDELGLFAKNLDKRGAVMGISKDYSLQEAIVLSRMIDAHK